MRCESTDTIEQLKLLQDPERCDGFTLIVQQAIDELEQFRQAAVTVRKCRRWLRQVSEEEHRDEDTTERARHDLDEALNLLEKMSDPKWRIGYAERVRDANQERALMKSEILRLREVERLARSVMTGLINHGAKILPHLMDSDDNDGQRLCVALGMTPRDMESEQTR